MPKLTNYPKLSVALRELQDTTDIKTSTLAAAFVCSESLMYDVMGNACWDDRFAKIRHAMATLPADVSAVIASVLNPPREVDSDINGDGKIDRRDLSAGLAQLVSDAREMLKRLEHTDSSTFSPEQAAAFVKDANRVGATVKAIISVVEKLTTGDQRSMRMGA